MIRRFYLISLLTLLFIPAAMAQSGNGGSERAQTLSLFLDCQGWCHQSYLRQEIPFVNFVRNRDVADIHLIITQQRTGSGGEEYTLRFLGRDRFEGKNDTLLYVSPQSDTQNDQRIGLARYIKIGLLPYLREYGVLANMDVTYEGELGDEAQVNAEEDPWNNWVFELNGNTRLDGEEKQNTVSFNGRASASRVTENWKTNFFYLQDYTRREFTNDGVTNTYITENYWSNVRVVKSITPHWSAGASTGLNSSTRRNVDLSVYVAPAVEYSVYPYQQYSERQITFLYQVSLGYYDYDEITVFNETTENLVEQSLRANMNFTQPWGEIEGSLNASAFMHDLNKNRFEVNMELDFRVFRGLSFTLSGRYAWINDQLGVPAGDIDDAEQLLNLRQQLTSYSYGASFGIEWTFGSIYNNVVNPRFNRGRGR